MEKFYTPSIEEFHVGFEYEWDKNGSDNWEKKTFDVNWYLDRFEEEVHNERIRVKSLDREDIELEGWEIDEVSSSYGGAFRFVINGGLWPKNNMRGVWMDADKNNTTKIEISSTTDGYNIDGPNYTKVFQGTIKNLSEFRRITKQLNIK